MHIVEGNEKSLKIIMHSSSPSLALHQLPLGFNSTVLDLQHDLKHYDYLQD